MEAHELAVLAGGVLIFALFSRRAEEGVLTYPMVFMLLGLLVSPAVLDLVAFPLNAAFVNGLAEITLVLTLFADASRIDMRRLNAQHDLPLRLLGLGLPLSVVAGALLALVVFPQMSLWEAAVLGVILAPTDAALGQAVVNNPSVPVRIRQTLNVESGLNDGLAFPALLVVVSLASVSGGADRGVADWLIFIAKQLALGPLAGVAVGYLGALAVERAVERHWMDHAFLQISVLALALLAFGDAELIGGNGYIAAFVAGLTVGTRSHALCAPLEDFGETEGRLLGLIVFLLFGATMVPRALAGLDWADVGYAVLSLTVVRMAPVALSLAGARLRPSTILFLGWFGPRGLASILYLLLIYEEGDLAAAGDIFVTVVMTVLLSVIAHGVSAAPGARLYGRHMKRLQDDPAARTEHRSVHEFPTRPRARVRGGPM